MSVVTVGQSVEVSAAQLWQEDVFKKNPASSQDKHSLGFGPEQVAQLEWQGSQVVPDKKNPSRHPQVPSPLTSLFVSLQERQLVAAPPLQVAQSSEHARHCFVVKPNGAS